MVTRHRFDIPSHRFPLWSIKRLKQRTEIPRIVGQAGAEQVVIFPEEEQAEAHGAGGRPIAAEY